MAGGRGAPLPRAASPSPPAEQLFRSEDSGRSGLLPWYAPVNAVPAYRSALTVAGGGRLLALGAAGDGYEGVFCSTDGGIRWFRACPR